MKQEKKTECKPKSTVYLNFILVLAILMCIVGLVLMCVFMIKYENGGSIAWQFAGLLTFPAFTIGALVLLGRHYKYFMLDEQRKIDRKYEKQSLECVPKCYKESVEERLLANGFAKKEQEIYYSLCHQPWQSRLVHTFIKWAVISDDKDLEEAISEESAFYFSEDATRKDSCCILFIAKKYFTQKELDLFKESCKQRLFYEQMVVGSINLCVMPVLVDTTQHKAYYLKPTSRSIRSMYAFCCKLLKSFLYKDSTV